MEKTKKPSATNTGQKDNSLMKIPQSSTTKVDRQENLKAIQFLYQLSSNHMDSQEGYEAKPNCQKISCGIGRYKT